MKKIIFAIMIISLAAISLAAFTSCSKKESNNVDLSSAVFETNISEDTLKEDILIEDVLKEEAITEDKTTTETLAISTETPVAEPDIVYDLQSKEIHFKNNSSFTAKEVIYRYFFVLDSHFVIGDAKHRVYLKYVDYDDASDKFIARETLLENVEFITDVSVEDIMGDYRTNEILNSPYTVIDGEEYLLTDIVTKGIHWNKTKGIITYSLFIEYIENGVICSKTVETDCVLTEESISTGGPIG